MPQLAVTEEDAAGGGRLRATRLLRRVGFLPLLGGIEPYTDLLDQLRRSVVDERAVVEFPYDWRLPLDYNGRLLADRCEQVLKVWRGVVAAERYADPDAVQVMLVAHSMGGLVARYATEVYGARAVVSRILTLATPHFGAVKALQMLATADMSVSLPLVGDVPLPRRLLRALHGLTVTCPAVYDLLPRYRCVTDTSDPEGVRHLADADVVGVGGSGELAADASRRAETLAAAASAADATPVHALAGSFQPTLQDVTIDGGACTFHYSTDVGGDATVYRRSAAPRGVTASPLPQRHGALAKSVEARIFVLDKLLGADELPPLGTRPISADLPTVATAGTPLTVTVSDAEPVSEDADPIGATVVSEDLATGYQTLWQPGLTRDHALTFTAPGLTPGLHRIIVNAGGFSPVTEVMLVDDPTSAED